MICFIDMDGVLVDFVSGVCEAHGRPDPYKSVDSIGIFDMEELWGITPDEFWKPTLKAGFWESLKKTPEADDLVSTCFRKFGANNCAILTSPSSDPSCVPGKCAWMREHFPILAKTMIFTSAKQFLAHKGSILIDDRDENVDKFEAAGGKAIRFPRIWNRNSSHFRYPMGYVLNHSVMREN